MIRKVGTGEMCLVHPPASVRLCLVTSLNLILAVTKTTDVSLTLTLSLTLSLSLTQMGLFTARYVNDTVPTQFA